MNSLKAALGKQSNKNQKISSNASIKKLSQSKSQTMWALDIQDQMAQVSLDNDAKLQILNKLIKKSFQKQNKLSATTFDRIIQDFQQQITTPSTSKSILSSFLVLQDKVTDLMDLYIKSQPQLHNYIEIFHQKIQEKIALLRMKQKKLKSKQLDRPPSRIFKKKNQVLDVNAIKFDVNIKSRQKSNGSNKKSNQKKLHKLFSKEKKTNTKDIKKGEEQHDDYLMSQSMMQTNQSVSFSSIMSSSVTVKQRRPRKNSGVQNNYMFKTQTKQQKKPQNEEDCDKTDNAFIFYRPKKTKK